MSGHIKRPMFCITESYIQAITSVKKSDQHSVLSLFFFLIHPTLLHSSACQYIVFYKKLQAIFILISLQLPFMLNDYGFFK